MMVVFLGVSNNPKPVSSVPRINGTSLNLQRRCCFVSRSLQVSVHLFEYHSVFDSKKARNIFSDNPMGRNLSYDSKHFWPEEPVIFFSSSLPSIGKRLTRKPS